ncbi:MAG: helix-turn-helix transcriptional regulator [Bacteroidales bacterium]|nr:helix-turn-helix transcriptional regulator [Bacteroidales bacterium]
MNKSKINIKVTKEETGYSAFANIGDDFVGTQGETWDELKEMLLDALNLAHEDKGLLYTIEDLQFDYDLESFFAFYKLINAKALSARIGMNQSLLSQYISGIKKPSPKQTQRILKGVQQIGRELSEVSFLL